MPGDFDRQHGFELGDRSVLGKDLFHANDLVRADLVIGPGHSMEYEGQGLEITGGFPVELRHR